MAYLCSEITDARCDWLKNWSHHLMQQQIIKLYSRVNLKLLIFGRELWSSGNGRRHMWIWLRVQIPALYTGWTWDFSHWFIVKMVVIGMIDEQFNFNLLLTLVCTQHVNKYNWFQPSLLERESEWTNVVRYTFHFGLRSWVLNFQTLMVIFVRILASQTLLCLFGKTESKQ